MEAGLIIANSIRLVRPLGEGGMGAVWLADHTALETQVVVKFMHAALGADAGSRERFSREAIAASKVKSPHVVQTFDHGVTPDGTAFIVMERLEGEDLAHRIEKGTMSPREVALVLTQTCRALGRAHAVGIVHRDIKPDNIFLCDVGSSEPFVKLLDFGIAKASLNPLLDNKTRTGAMMGTPYYMSPEQFAGSKEIDFRTDLWSLGIAAYECLTGKRPFDADTIGGLAIAVHSGPLPLLSNVRPDLAPFDPWFAVACNRQPAGRFGSAKEFADAFEAVAFQLGAVPGGTLPAGVTRPAFGTNPAAFSGTDPAGIPAVPAALLMSTGATGAFSVGDVGAPAPPVLPRSGVPRAVMIAVAATLGVVGIGAFAVARSSRQPAIATEQPAKAVASPAAPPPEAPKPPEAPQRLADLPAAAAPDVPPAPAPAPASAPVAAAHPWKVGSAPAAASPAQHPVAVGIPAPAASHAAAAPPTPKAPVNCNPPYTFDSAGVKHPKVECL